MPSRIQRPCARPTCGRLVDKGYCAAHEAARQAMELRIEREILERNRPNSYRRGYDKEWFRFRWHFLQRAENRVCSDCGQAESAHVHHIKKVRTHPHLRLVDTNCRALCASCHSKRTRAGE